MNLKKYITTKIVLKTKKIIFFDGDGTLWYPIKTKYTEKPHWLYKDKSIKNHHEHLMVIPTVESTLRKLKKVGVLTVVLSTHPHEIDEAYKIIDKKVKHFNLKELFTEVHATREYHESKGEYIVEILKKLNIPKTQALMIGDNYAWDYKPARDIGVDALLMQSDYMKKDKRLKTIKKLSDLFDYIKSAKVSIPMRRKGLSFVAESRLKNVTKKLTHNQVRSVVAKRK
ncbi:MAG: HAD-IIIC family phosphatase [Minisyncoccia bacterium]